MKCEEDRLYFLDVSALCFALTNHDLPSLPLSGVHLPREGLGLYIQESKIGRF